MIKEILKIKKVFNLSKSNSSIKNKQPKDFEYFRKNILHEIRKF